MRTVLIILGGVVLWGATALVVRWMGSDAARALGTAARVFVPVWLLLAAANMYVGVSRAGYSVREELPIFLVIFVVPAAVALLAAWKWR